MLVRRSKRKLVQSALALSATVLLSGCAANGVGIVNASILCDTVEVVDVSKKDRITDETAEKIEGNNLFIEHTCGIEKAVS